MSDKYMKLYETMFPARPAFSVYIDDTRPHAICPALTAQREAGSEQVEIVIGRYITPAEVAAMVNGLPDKVDNQDKPLFGLITYSSVTEQELRMFCERTLQALDAESHLDIRRMCDAAQGA